MTKFKVGNKIKIIDGNFLLDHQDQKIGNGVIAKIENTGDEWVTYFFQNGYKNVYEDEDLELVEDHKMKFKIGDRVKFRGKGDVNQIPKYYTQHHGIPKEKIVHGNIILNENYKKDFARVVDVYNEFYIVEYEDYTNNKVRLGFKEDVLDFVEPFKDGDKVMLSIPRDREHYKFDGCVGEIIFINEEGIAVQTPTFVVPCNPDELELI